MTSMHNEDDFDRLHLVQAQLAAAQAEEQRALKAFTDYTRAGGKDEAEFRGLRKATSEARARAILKALS